MFANFFKLKLEKNVYSSSESGVNDLEIDLVAILWDNKLISKELVYDIYGKDKKIEKMKERKNDFRYLRRTKIQICEYELLTQDILFKSIELKQYKEKMPYLFRLNSDI